MVQDFADLIEEIAANPRTGIHIGNNCFKIRLAIGSKGKGKRGGARVITYLYLESDIVYLLTMYDKSEKADIKTSELREMIGSLDLG